MTYCIILSHVISHEKFFGHLFFSNIFICIALLLILSFILLYIVPGDLAADMGNQARLSAAGTL